MQNIIEISSENTTESEKNFNSQETILEDKMNTFFYSNETPRIVEHAASKKYPKIILGEVLSVETKSNLEVYELVKFFRSLMYLAFHRSLIVIHK